MEGYEFPKENFLCKLLKHKYTQDEVIVKKITPRRYKVSRYRYCERCKITFKENHGIYSKEVLDRHLVMFGDIEDRVYEKYNEVNK
jgi:hypothetical protein